MLNIVNTEREFLMTDEDFYFLGQLATSYTGIVFAPHKRDLIYSRLSRRLRACGLQEFSQYCALLQGEQGQQEIEHMVNALTTNFTSFFREPHHFEHLREAVIAPFIAQESKSRLRIWSAACSTGMEPYSIAMAMVSAHSHIAQKDVRVLATDIDSRVLDTARKARYAINETEKLPRNYHNFFDASRVENEVQVNKAVRDLVSFRQLNLMSDWPMQGKFDAIFCRNVLIYFDKETKRELVHRLAGKLVPNGFLYIGHSENLNGISDRFSLVGRTTYQRVDA
jgi:chemotaxis protein methyltransferase CheR